MRMTDVRRLALFAATLALGFLVTPADAGCHKGASAQEMSSCGVESLGLSSYSFSSQVIVSAQSAPATFFAAPIMFAEPAGFGVTKTKTKSKFFGGMSRGRAFSRSAGGCN